MRVIIDLLALFGVGLIACGAFVVWGLGVSLMVGGVMLLCLSLVAAKAHGLLDASDP